MKLAITLLAALALAGCATTADVDMARAHYEAQSRANDRPVLHMKARDGEDMVLVGVDELRVYGGSAEVSAYRQQHHPAWSILGDALRLGLPIYLGGRAAVDLADTVGRRVGEVAQNPTVVEQPAPTIVEQPPPIAAPDPVIVPSPDPIIVQPPDPIFGPDPIIVPGAP